MLTTDTPTLCKSLARKAKQASRILAGTARDRKDAWLCRVADQLIQDQSAVLEANASDINLGRELGLSSASLDRLRLTPERLVSMAEGLKQVVCLPDPVGRVLDESTRPNGLLLRKVSVPLGVILFIYESRPNVTVDAAGLCVKSGNAIILRGGKEALASNGALCQILRASLAAEGLPEDAVQLVPTSDRGAVGELLRLPEWIDLVIPRGGESLIRRVAAEARMPVLKHYRGNCHIYVDRAADMDMAERIIVNAKCQRPGVCNAAESLLVHAQIASEALPRVAKALLREGVEIRGCLETCALVPEAKEAVEADFSAEYLDLIISMKVVRSLDEAIDHINEHGSQHSDAIVTQDAQAAQRFTERVDSAAVLVNASTRFHDGFEFGLGAEIGISTDKIHARGPCGLVELTTYKYIVQGDGQIRGG